MQVRQATLADVPAIVRMSERFYETTSYNRWADFNADTVEALAENLTENHVMLVAEHEGQVVGMVGLFVAPFMFNADKTGAYEVVWWVDPEGRATGAGKALLRAIEPACHAKGCASIQMVHLHNSPPQAAMLYERAGYAHTESSYTKLL
jgi:GNAT superfamily N-acetyltransferase